MTPYILLIAKILLSFLIFRAKCLTCDGCVTVYHYKCLQNCTNVTNLYLNSSGYDSWEMLNRFSNISVHILYMDHNNITSLKNKVTCLERTQIVSIKDNKIENISSQIFSSMTNLKKLYLGENKILRIHPETFNWSKLEVLNLENNKINEIDFLIAIRYSVITLTLSKNNIDNVDVFSSNAFTKILVLDLNCNAIKYLNENFFENLPNIKDIDLSENKIHTIASSVNVRRSIRLNNNQLNCFNYTYFQTITLNDNCFYAEFKEDIMKYIENKNKSFTNKYVTVLPKDYCKILNLNEKIGELNTYTPFNLVITIIIAIILMIIITLALIWVAIKCVRFFKRCTQHEKEPERIELRQMRPMIPYGRGSLSRNSRMSRSNTSSYSTNYDRVTNPHRTTWTLPSNYSTVENLYESIDTPRQSRTVNEKSDSHIS